MYVFGHNMLTKISEIKSWREESPYTKELILVHKKNEEREQALLIIEGEYVSLYSQLA